MNGLATAQRMYDRREPTAQWGSEQDRQEAIDQMARRLEKEYVYAAPSRLSTQIELGDELMRNARENTPDAVVRCLVAGNREALFDLMLSEYGAAIKRLADHYAIKAIEAQG